MNHTFACISKKKKEKCIVSDPHVSIFSFLFWGAMKQCPIAAKIAVSIGILPSCVLNDILTYM